MTWNFLKDHIDKHVTKNITTEDHDKGHHVINEYNYKVYKECDHHSHPYCKRCKKVVKGIYK